MTRRGLVVGKFYPPHRGHSHLINFARLRVDELWVIVCGKPEQIPGGELRASWLQQLHPDIHVLLIDDKLDVDDSRVWAENSIRWLGFVPDCVFTSEDYGESFAQYLGCQHVLVDKERLTVTVSGTVVREDPLSCWEFLEPPVRAFYAKRVCLVGAESTGKTTLARALAEHYRTLWVPEYGREYSERKLREEGDCAWRSEEFAHIAATQREREDQAASQANKVLICDTDAFATAIWHVRYLGVRSPAVDAIVATHRRPDLYLVPDVDTPFVQDGTRDGELIREWMHEAFIEELIKQGHDFRLLSGSFRERLQEAIRHIDQVMTCAAR